MFIENYFFYFVEFTVKTNQTRACSYVVFFEFYFVIVEALFGEVFFFDLFKKYLHILIKFCKYAKNYAYYFKF